MKAQTVRLFFALWPDDEVRNQLVKVSRNIQLSKHGRSMRKANLHMTLHFIGNTDVENAKCLQQVANKVIAQPFSLKIDKAGQFKHPGIVWLGCSAVPAGLHRLHHELGEVISSCDFEPEKRHYRPHVSLYRKAALDETASEISSIEWQVDSFSLISSQQDRQGVIYRELQRYPLNQTLPSATDTA